jgi:hypothetical protein
MSEQPPLPAAGWYPDGRGAVRYWDGKAWTQHVQPPPSQTPPPAGAASGGAAGGAAAGAAAGAAGAAAAGAADQPTEALPTDAGAAADQDPAHHGAGPVAHEPPLHEIEEAQLAQSMPMAGGATVPADPSATAVMPTVGAADAAGEAPARKPFYRRGWFLAALLVVLGLILAGVAFALLFGDDDDDEPTPSPRPTVSTPAATAFPTVPTVPPTVVPTVPTVPPTVVPTVPTVPPTVVPTVPTVPPTVVPTVPTVVPTVTP